MSDPTQVNPQVVDAVKVNQQYAMTKDIINRAGAGKAYQAVAQSSAMAVQDATDNLRNLGTISSTAIGSAFAMMMNDPENMEKYQEIVKLANNVMEKASCLYSNVGQDAAKVLRGFPPDASSNN